MANKIYPDASAVTLVSVQSSEFTVTIYLEGNATLYVPIGESRSVELIGDAFLTIEQSTAPTKAYIGPGSAFAKRMAAYWKDVSERLIAEEKTLPDMAD